MTQGRRSISDYASALTAKTDPAHSLFSRRAVWAAAAAVLVFAALLFTLPDVTNNPRPLAEYGEKTLLQLLAAEVRGRLIHSGHIRVMKRPIPIPSMSRLTSTPI